MNDCVFFCICEEAFECDCSQCKEYLSMNEGYGAEIYAKYLTRCGREYLSMNEGREADIHAEYLTRCEQVAACLRRIKAEEREKMEDDKK